jgi:hypothetical protein
LNNGLQETQRYWDKRAAESATDCERVEQSQRMRFEAFVLYHDLNGKSLARATCGHTYV